MADMSVKSQSGALGSAGVEQRRSLAPGQSGFRLARIAGIEVRVDWSLAVVFWLIAFNLGTGLLPARHLNWSGGLIWVAAFAAAALFFLSVLAHELAHALVGRARGVPIEGITLFLFGGVSRLGGEPKSPGAEFLMAIVGPLTSLVIGIICTALGAAFADRSAADGLELSSFGPAATLLLWLGSSNLALAIFNILPGFPLDGGRVLRAILWKAMGDLRKATRGATIAGRVIAGLLIFVGVTMAFGARFPLLGTGLAQGLWLVLIGWFLDNAALNSYRQLVVTQLLAGVPVSRLMRRDVETIDADLPVSTLVDRFFAQSDQRCYLVRDGDQVTGLVCMPDLLKVERDAWPETPVRAIMSELGDLKAVRPDEDAAEALSKLAAQDVDQLPVVEGGKLAGILRRGDLLRWIELSASAA